MDINLKQLMTVHSQFGIENHFGIQNEFSSKLIIDPNPSYFESDLIYDRENIDRIFLLHGCEPPKLNEITSKIIENHSKFDKIFSFSQEVLQKCENSEQFQFGSCWVLMDREKNLECNRSNYFNHFNTEKKFKVSFIKSGKNYLEGHQLRHFVPEVLSQLKNLEVYFPEKLSNKISLFDDSMFHIAIENSKFNNFFTEKIIDCFMTYTIPIYWGCPNITTYFNEKGIIFFENINELETILKNLTIFDYNRRLPYIKENYHIALENYAFFFDNIKERITKFNESHPFDRTK
jgi:hypothetical protein